MGNKAEKHQKEPTMLLNLYDDPKGAINPHHYKKYIVLHETGHALGFHHEHQHPDIGTDIFIRDKIMSDISTNVGDKDKFYEENFGVKAKKNEYPFDKHSVMMYR